MATATATEMATSLVATATATLGGRAVGVAATTATTATTEEMSINGILVVVFCFGQEYLFMEPKFRTQIKKNKGEKFRETNRGTGTILMIFI